MVFSLAVDVKTEVVPPKTVESMDVDQNTSGGGNTTEKSKKLPVVGPTVAKVEDKESLFCEKCHKPFSTVILLKYHYCSHFMSLLKKNYEHLLDSNNNCQECKRTFQNSRRLLLHIGVNHDKINDILEYRGIHLFFEGQRVFKYYPPTWKLVYCCKLVP